MISFMQLYLKCYCQTQSHLDFVLGVLWFCILSLGIRSILSYFSKTCIMTVSRLRVFVRNGCWILSSAFSASIDVIMWFLSSLAFPNPRKFSRAHLGSLLPPALRHPLIYYFLFPSICLFWAFPLNGILHMQSFVSGFCHLA